MKKLTTAFTAFAVLQIAVLLVIQLEVPMILASWAASAALISGLRISPAARPWAVGISHLTCGTVGLGVLLIAQGGIPFSAHWLIAPAVGLAVLGMLAFGAFHPPAAGNAAIPLIAATQAGGFAITFIFGALVLAVLAASLDHYETTKEEV